jgi:NADH:ubiquinone oxidoreductase subunit D
VSSLNACRVLTLHADDSFPNRVQECRTAFRIISQRLQRCLKALTKSTTTTSLSAPRASMTMKESMGAFIHHFKLFLRRLQRCAGEAYTAIEAPRAEIGVYLVSDGSQRTYRCKVRAPGFAHMAGSDFISRFCGILGLRTVLIFSSSATPVRAGRCRHHRYHGLGLP